MSPSGTLLSATFPAWADVVMEEVVHREWQHARQMAAPTGHVRDAAVMQTRARIEWNETP